MAEDETTENDTARAAAADAEQALETIEAEAATELPAGESTEAPESAPPPLRSRRSRRQGGGAGRGRPAPEPTQGA